MADQAGIADRIRFAGYVHYNETVHYYAISWVYVLPSVTTPVFKEPWGLVVNEAFNPGVPVIASEAVGAVSYTHLRAHENPEHLVCRLLLEKKKIRPHITICDIKYQPQNETKNNNYKTRLTNISMSSSTKYRE